jgi:hypothetical protein
MVKWEASATSLSMDVLVPTSTMASVSVPAMGKKAFDLTITESGTKVFTAGKFIPGAVKGISGASIDERNLAIVFEVVSGAYTFVSA